MKLLDDNILKLEKVHSKLVVLVITSVLDALCILLQGVSLGTALQLLWQGAGSGLFEISNIALASILFLAGYGARQLISFARARLMSTWAFAQADALQKQLIEQSFVGGPAFVQKNGSGNITASLIEGTDRIENYLEILLPKVTDLIAIPVILSIGLLVLDWVSGVIALLMIPFIALYMKMLGRGAREAAQRQHGSYVRLGNHFMDTLRGIRTLGYFGRIQAASEEVFVVSERARKTSMETIRIATLSSLMLDLFRTFALAAIAIMLGFRLMDGSIGLLNALAVLIIVPEYFAAIRRFSADFHASLDGKTQLAATLEMIEEGAAIQNGTVDASCQKKDMQLGLTQSETPQESTATGSATAESAEAESTATGSATALGEDKATSAVQAAPLVAAKAEGSVAQKALELAAQDVSYGYPCKAGCETDVLAKVNFSINGARKVGIVGVSGSGKSTLARIIAGFAAPSSGHMVVQGKPFDLCSEQWRRSVAYIPQNPHLFHGSVRDNIVFYCPTASDDEVVQAVHAAGLDEVVRDLPDGLDTVIGDGGRQLSGGQAQRIALARAFLDTTRSVIVFDEPTAHLDLETEYALKKTMLPLIDDRCIFFATHRVHWMRDMDLLLVLDQGRIVESGSFDELLPKDGAFTKLVRQLVGDEVG